MSVVERTRVALSTVRRRRFGGLGRRAAASAPPESFFVGSAIFHYLGPAFAVLLFALVEPVGVAWLRIAIAAAVFAAWRRPWHAVSRLDPASRRNVAAMGVVLGLMNPCFYVAIDRLPLGTVAAIEFLPVVALAAAGMRTARNGVALAFANALLFALYIVCAHRVASQSRVAGIDGLAGAMLVAVVVSTPIGLASALPALVDPVALAAAAGVAVTSSVIPYVFDQLAMARMPRATYALLVSLLPATATLVGVIVLAQVPSQLELLGVGLVVAGVGLHRDRPAATA